MLKLQYSHDERPTGSKSVEEEQRWSRRKESRIGWRAGSSRPAEDEVLAYKPYRLTSRRTHAQQRDN